METYFLGYKRCLLSNNVPQTLRRSYSIRLLKVNAASYKIKTAFEVRKKERKLFE
jgi:hypothetical protein